VPQSRDKGFTTVGDLPNPDLNPLLNPTLSRNLGRWAEVYFTTPPERREEAVEKLLRELEGAPARAATQALEPVATQQPPLPGAQAPVYAQTCSQCGQGYEIPQRYCGMCGTPLLAGIAQRETRFVAVPLSSRAGLETAPLRLEFSRDSTDVPADTATTASLLAHHRAAGEIPWLRDRSAPAQAPASRASYFPLRWYAATAVMVAVAALFYAESNPSRRASPVTQSRPAVPQDPRAVPERPPTPMDAPAQAAPAPEPLPWQGNAQPAADLQKIAPSAPQTPLASNQPKPDPAATRLQPMPSSAAAATVAPAEWTSNSANGLAELLQAENYLNGTHGRRDAAAAARLLWTAVGKENITAVLLLSDMYLIGDGVPKSCDQAKVLLSAAARKQFAQAADKLRSLEQSGCP
jgi:hypothetical protein